MAVSVTSLSSNGLRDWLIQRVSAIVLAIYVVFLLGYIFFHPHLNYYLWQSLFANQWMQVATIFVLLNLLLHSWVGIWIVITDYIKPFIIRLLVQMAVIIALIGYFIWGIEILRSI